MEKRKLDGTHSKAMLIHLKKQGEMLMELHQSFSHELHKLQVEEEMLMRRFYEAMSAEHSTKALEDDNVSNCLKFSEES